MQLRAFGYPLQQGSPIVAVHIHKGLPQDNGPIFLGICGNVAPFLTPVLDRPAGGGSLFRCALVPVYSALLARALLPGAHARSALACSLLAPLAAAPMQQC